MLAQTLKSLGHTCSRGGVYRSLIKSRSKQARYDPFLFYALDGYSYLTRCYTNILKAEDKIYSTVLRTKELWRSSLSLLNKGEYAEAESMILGAIGLSDKVSGDVHRVAELEGMDNFDLQYAKFHITLAYIRQGKGNVNEAETLYNKYLSTCEKGDLSEYAIALYNYAELQFSKQNYSKAIELSRKAIEILKQESTNLEVIAGALSNLSGYLVETGDLNGAKTAAQESLDLFIKALGKSNPYTRSSMSNLHRILTLSKSEKELKELEAQWKRDDSFGNDLVMPEDKVESYKETLLQSDFSIRKCDALGVFKEPGLYKQELLGFIAECEKRGVDINDPAFSVLLEQELAFLKYGKKRSLNLLEKETYKYKKDLELRLSDWSENLDKVKNVEEVIREANDKVLQHINTNIEERKQRLIRRQERYKQEEQFALAHPPMADE